MMRGMNAKDEKVLLIYGAKARHAESCVQYFTKTVGRGTGSAPNDPHHRNKQGMKIQTQKFGTGFYQNWLHRCKNARVGEENTNVLRQ